MRISLCQSDIRANEVSFGGVTPGNAERKDVIGKHLQTRDLRSGCILSMTWSNKNVRGFVGESAG